MTTSILVRGREGRVDWTSDWPFGRLVALYATGILEVHIDFVEMNQFWDSLLFSLKFQGTGFRGSDFVLNIDLSQILGCQLTRDDCIASCK